MVNAGKWQLLKSVNDGAAGNQIII